MSWIERALAYMVVYCFIELCFTSLIKPVEAGGHEIRPTVFGKCAPIAAPFYGLAGVFILEPYHDLWPLAIAQWDYWVGLLVRSLVFPLVMWVIEIIIGGLIYYPTKWALRDKLGGKEIRAWYYYGRWALCNRFINLQMAPAWILLWPFFELFHSYLTRF